MNLLADESIGKSLVETLRENGHNVLYIAEFSPSIDDEEVLHQANLNRALLLTEDKDFGELVFRQGLVHMGGSVYSSFRSISTNKSSKCFNSLGKSRR